MIISFSFLITLLLVQFTVNQYIKGKQVFIDCDITDCLKTIHFQFSLSNDLSNKNYLKVSLQQVIHYQVTAPFYIDLLPQPLYLKVYLVRVLDQYNYELKVFTEKEIQPIYYIQFNEVLKASVYYQLKFHILDERVRSTLSSSVNVISLETITDPAFTMVIDSNKGLSFLQLKDQQEDILEIQTTFLSLFPRTIGLKQTLFIDIQVPDFSELLRGKIKLSNQEFRFVKNTDNQLCVSRERNYWPNIQVMTDFDCEDQTDGDETQYILLTMRSRKNKYIFVKQEPQTFIRLEMVLQNPNSVQQKCDLNVEYFRQYSSQLLATAMKKNFIYTKQISTLSHTLTLGTGEYTPNYDLIVPLKLARQSSATPLNPVYNTITIRFTLKSQTPQNQELFIKVGFQLDETALILEGSITHNFNNFDDRVITCREEFIAIKQSRAISCTGVGQLLESNEYYLRLSMYLPYDRDEPSILLEQFGTLTIVTPLTINEGDNVFKLIKSKKELLSYDTNQYRLFGKNLEAIQSLNNYVQSVVIIGLIEEFYDYVRIAEQIIPTNFLNKKSIFVPTDNGHFLRYLQQDSQVFILKRINDISLNGNVNKQINSVPLLSLSIAKNIVELETINVNDWTPQSATWNKQIISTHPAIVIQTITQLKQGSLTTTKSISASDQFQTLVISYRNGPNDVYQSLTVPFQMIILCPKEVQFAYLPNPPDPQVTPVPTITLQQGSASLLIGSTAEVYESQSQLNAFSLIKVNFPKLDLINTQSKFDQFFSTTADNYFGLSQIKIAKSSMLDFYIFNVDNIDGVDRPPNLLSVTSMQLINTYSLLPADPSFKVSLSNYYNNDDFKSSIPIIMNIQFGTFSSGSNPTRIKLFFSGLDFYESNGNTNEGYCVSSSSNNERHSCRALRNYIGGFDGMLDIISSENKKITIVSKAKSGVYGGINFQFAQVDEFNQIINIQPKISQFSFSQSNDMTVPIFKDSNIASVDYNLQACLSCRLGQAATLTFSALHTENAPVINSLQNDNSAFTIFFSVPLRSITVTSPMAGQSCSQIEFSDNLIVYCKVEIGTVNTNNIQLVDAFIDQNYGADITGYAGYSKNDGTLASQSQFSYQFQQVVQIDNIISSSLTGNRTSDIVYFDFDFPIDLQIDFSVRILLTSSEWPLSLSENSKCTIYLRAELDIILHHCSLEFQSNFIQANIYELNNKIPKNDKLRLVISGIKTSQSFQVSNLEYLIQLFYETNSLFAQSNPAQLTLTNDQLLLFLEISNFEVLPFNRGAEGYLMLNFKFNFQITYGEYIRIHLDDFLDTLAESIQCQVQDVLDDGSEVLSSNWGINYNKNIQFIDLIYLADGFQFKPSYKLHCSGLTIPDADYISDIYATLENQQKNVILISNYIPFPKFKVSIPSVYDYTAQMMYFAANIGTLKLTLFSQSVNFSSFDHRVIVQFGNEWQIDSQNVFCYQENLYILDCSFNHGNRLVIHTFAKFVPFTYPIIVTIHNVVPVKASPSVFVALDLDFDDSLYSEYSIAKINFQLNSFEPENSIFITQYRFKNLYYQTYPVEYQIDFITQNSIPLDDFIILDLPQLFYQYQKINQLDISVFGIYTTETIKRDDKLNLANAISKCGLTITFQLKENIIPNKEYTIILPTILNPLVIEQYAPSINNQLFVIKAAQSGFEQEASIYQIYAISQPSNDNYNLLNYNLNTIQTQLQLFSKISKQQVSSLYIVNGVLSEELCITLKDLNSLPLPRSFILSLFNSQSVTIYNNSVTVFSGTDQNCFRLYSYNAKGETILLFNTQGDGGFYQLLTLNLFVGLSFRQELQLKSKEFTIFKGKINYILLQSMQLFDPPLKILTKINNYLLQLRQESITFATDSTKAILIIDVPEVIDVISEQIILYCEDSESRVLETYITINLIDFPAGTSSQIQVSKTQTDINSVTFTVSCPQYSYLQYNFAKYFIDDIELCKMNQNQLNALLFPDLYEKGPINIKNYAHFYDCKFIQDSIEFRTPEVQTQIINYLQYFTSITISDLFASTNYQIQMSCITPIYQQSSRMLETNSPFYYENTIQTLTNSAKCQKFKVKFQKALIKEEIQQFACVLTMQFEADPRLQKNYRYFKNNFRIVSDNGLQCNYLFEQNGNPFLSLTNGLSTDEIFFFIGKHLHLSIDHITPQVEQIALDIPKFIEDLNQDIQGLPKIESFEILPAVDDQIGTFVAGSKVTTGYTWAYMAPITLDKDCWIYLIVRQGEETAITSMEMLYTKDYLLYKKLYGKSVDLKLTQLPHNSTFTIYLMASTDDPFEEARKTSEIKKVSFKTNEHVVLISGKMLGILIILISFML